MDAKPQRPRTRVTDENMLPPFLPAAAHKTLHQRNKSTPALSGLAQATLRATQKKILGEVNGNIRPAQPAKDDSEVGKASPGKLLMQETTKPTTFSTFARPAARPLAPRATTALNIPISTASTSISLKQALAAQPSQPDAEPMRKVAPKKSLKVLRELPPVQAEAEIKTVPAAPVNHTLAAPAKHAPSHAVTTMPVTQKTLLDSLPTQLQEVRKTESVPLKDEAAVAIAVKPVDMAMDMFPPGVSNEAEYLSYLDINAAQYQLQQQDLNAVPSQGSYLPGSVEPYYEVDEEEYAYEDGYTTARSFGLHGESTGGVTTILAPRVTDKVDLEIQLAKEFVEATRPTEDIDDEAWDTSMVAEYGDEIFAYMREMEDRMAPNPTYMDQQTEIQWSMRSVLMDWVIQVHQRFSLLPETLFLTVNYIDRFLSCKVVSLGKLQLVGATAIFVAAKYEEVQCPTIAEIIYMVDGGYSADELLKAERFMLSMLQFELGWPGPMSFLRRISKADDYDLETRTLAKYFLEVTIMDERFVGCTPSFLAAGAHCMARLMIHDDEWTKAHVYYSNYTWSQLRQLLAAILECCEDPNKHHSAVYDKYTDKRFKRSSLFVAGKMAAGFRLPLDNPAPRPPTPRSSMSSILQ